MLFWAAVINGVVAVPIMFATVTIVSSEHGRRSFRLPAWLRTLGWIAAILMTVAVLLFGWSIVT
jgi:Mn2+/Fe2+ NRAMP family transporter